jgi:hypothetical protein
VHDGGFGSVEVSEHPDPSAKADALAHPELPSTVYVLVHVVCLPLYWVEAYGRPILSV